MRPKLIITVIMLLFSYTSSYAQDYFITNTLPGNDLIAYTTLQYGRKDFGFGVISSKGIMKWQIPVPGYPLGMGKFENDVLFFYSFKDPALTWASNEVHAARIDLHSKKIIDDKIVYSRKSKYETDLFILNDPQGNFSYLLVRTTAMKSPFGTGVGRYKTQKMSTSELSIISLETNLEPNVKDLKSIALESVFVTACVGMNSDVYVSSLSNDQLITEKFDSAANLKAKLSTEAPVSTKKDFFPIIKYDARRGDCIDLAIAYSNNTKDDIMRSFRFDFNDQRAIASDEEILDKSYEKQLEKTAGKKLSNFKSIKDLTPVQILETNDKVIVLKEITFTKTSPKDPNVNTYMRNGGIISIYSKDLHLLSEVVIDKFFGTFIMGITGIYGQLKNEKLYAVTCELAGAGKYKTYLYTININDGSMERKELEKEDAGKGWITNPTTVAWFSNNFITPFSSGKAFIHLKFETDLQSEKY